jgi:hypothetical protein
MRRDRDQWILAVPLVLVALLWLLAGIRGCASLVEEPAAYEVTQ